MSLLIAREEKRFYKGNKPILSIELPKKTLSYLRIDIAGPLPISVRFRHYLSGIDKFTRRPEARLLAETVAQTFYTGRIARLRTPNKITADRGSQFSFSASQALGKFMEIKLIHTTFFHPVVNETFGRWHREFKNVIL